MSYTVIKRAALAVQRVRLIDEHDADIYNLIRENTVGGPSLVFHRYHEKKGLPRSDKPYTATADDYVKKL